MSITFLTVNVVCFWKTGISDSLLLYTRLLQYAVLSGLDSCCTCNFTLIESCLSMFITPWPFSVNHSLSLFPWRAVWVLSFLVFIPLKMFPGCTSNTFPEQSSLNLQYNTLSSELLFFLYILNALCVTFFLSKHSLSNQEWLIIIILVKRCSLTRVKLTALYKHWSIDWWLLLYSAILRSQADSLRSHVILHEWLVYFIARFLISTEVVYLQRWHGWCHMNLLPPRRVLCTPYNHAPYHFMQSHIRKVYACLAVTCRLHVW